MTRYGPARVERLLIVPDAHADPAYPNDRFDWLGQYIAARKVDVVVNIGDLGSMQSLSDHDKHSAIFEGRRYVKDTAAVRDAVARMMRPVRHPCRWFITLGNHEAFIDRYAGRAAEMQEAISVRDLGFFDAGWEVVPFLEKLDVGGFLFSHFFANLKGQPIGGVNVAEALIRTQHESVVAGHTHLRSYSQHITARGRPFHALNVGCYVAEEHDESWSRGTQDRWWRGVVELEGVEGGDFQSMTWTSMAQLRALYGASRSHGHVPEVDMSGLSFDDDETHIARPADDAPHAVWARFLGCDESTVRKYRRLGIPPSAWRQKGAA